VSHTPFAYALVAALANVAGAAVLTWRAKWSDEALDTLIALAAGFMIAVSLTDLLPDAIAQTGHAGAVAALLGFLLVHLTQHVLAPHFHFGEEVHTVSESVGVSALAGLLLHTFVDGVAIASGFHVSEALGLLVFLAIVLHKLPEGLAISSLFLAAGAGRQKAFYAATALGVATLIGVSVTDHVGILESYGLAVSAGVTLYVGASNLIPEFQAKRRWQPQIGFFVGCGLYFLARTIVGL
jgi:ZIP family zinc transporter/zinc and cadmium transporter